MFSIMVDSRSLSWTLWHPFLPSPTVAAKRLMWVFPPNPVQARSWLAQANHFNLAFCFSNLFRFNNNPGLSQSAWFVLASVIDLEPRMWPKIDQREGSPGHLMTGESSSLLLGMVECVAWDSNNRFPTWKEACLRGQSTQTPWETEKHSHSSVTLLLQPGSTSGLFS